MARTKRFCSYCSKEGAKCLCSRCMNASYCSSDCQEHDWNAHRLQCSLKEKPEKDECTCPSCGRGGLEQEAPFMCLQCGTLTMCDACGNLEGGTDDHRFCSKCAADPATKVVNYDKLRALVQENPELPHANCIRLGLASVQPEMDKGEILRLANEEEYPPAMHVLGALFAGSTDLPVDIGSWSFALQETSNNPFDVNIEESHNWYSKAADLGYNPSRYMMGKHYLDKTFPHSHGRRVATGYFRTAANDGYILAALHLAILEEDHTLEDYGIGTPHPEEAVRVLRRSVDKFPPDVAKSARTYLNEMGVSVSNDVDDNNVAAADAVEGGGGQE